jgi:CubicO group peptidase (beta-lactamase class C family)
MTKTLRATVMGLIALVGAQAWGQSATSPVPNPPRVLFPLPAQPEGTPWPVPDWPVAEPGADVDRPSVEGLIEAAFRSQKLDLMGETRALLIVHRGRIVYERYRPPYGPSTRLVSWSMAKSVTHALVGRAVATGLIADNDAPMPGRWAQGDARAAISWRQWLTMTDGLAYAESGVKDLQANDVAQMMYGPGRFDVVGYVLNLPVAHPPGTRWNYSTAGFHMIADALARVIGAGECTLEGQRRNAASLSPMTACASPRERKFNEWAQGALFGPLGMDAEIEFDAAGTFLGGSLVFASARDWAKFGLLYLRDGVWNGTRLLPEGWVNFARAPGPDANVNVYGAGFWITPPTGSPIRPAGHASPLPPEDSFSAQGREGQVVWIVPSRDLVIVRLGLMPSHIENWQVLYDWCQAVAIGFPEISPAP